MKIDNFTNPIYFIPIAIIAIGLVSSVVMMFVKGKPVFGVVKMRTGQIYANLIDAALLLVFGIAGLFITKQSKTFLVIYFIFAVFSLFLFFVTYSFRITYDELGFERKRLFKKTSYTYSDITELRGYDPTDDGYDTMKIVTGKKSFDVGKSYLGGKEFIEYVKERRSDLVK